MIKVGYLVEVQVESEEQLPHLDESVREGIRKDWGQHSEVRRHYVIPGAQASPILRSESPLWNE